MKIFIILNYFFLALMFGFFILTTTWQWYPYQVVKLNEPTRMVKEVYKPGDHLDWYINSTQLTSGVRAHVTREIECKIDDPTTTTTTTRKYALPDTDFTTEGKTSKFIQSSFFVPLNAFPGTHCTVNIIGSYQVNPIRTVIFTDRTSEFEIQN